MKSSLKAKKTTRKSTAAGPSKPRARQLKSVLSRTDSEAKPVITKKAILSVKKPARRRWWSLFRYFGLALVVIALAVLMGVRRQLQLETRSKGGSILRKTLHHAPVAEQIPTAPLFITG